jgi:uncharacterized protein YrrD
MSEQPQVSWKAIEAGAAVFTRDGNEAGRVTKVVGDQDADVFNGLAVRIDTFGDERLVDADAVQSIWPDRIEISLTVDQLESLPSFEESVEVQFRPGRRSFLDRLRRP